MKSPNFFTRLLHVLKRKVFAGFSLVEAMLGIFIISVVIGGPMVIAGRAAQDIRYSKEVFTATFLGEEAIELIRFKRDTLSLECNQNAGGASCPLSVMAANPTVTDLQNEAAWKIFKDQFGYSTNSQCFSASGCAFDAKSILTSPIIQPTDIYNASTSGPTSCDNLYMDNSAATTRVSGTSSLDFMYLCTVHKVPSSINTQMQRIIKMTSTSTNSCPSYECAYEDDVKVDVTVIYNFRGFPKSVTVTDFIKPRS